MPLMEAGQAYPFSWPPLPDGGLPIWQGNGFSVGNVQTHVLSYAQGVSGWNDELAGLVDAEVGPEKPVVKASHRHTMSELDRWLTKKDGGVIIEVGCSTGYMLEKLSTAYPGCHVIGIDYAYPPLVNLSKRMPQTPLVHMDLVHNPLPSQIADAVIILNVLEHIEDDAKALANLYQLVKPEGVLIIEVPAMPQLYDVFDKYVHHHRRYRMTDLLALLEDTGFEVLHRSHLGFLVYPLVWWGKRKNQRLLSASLDIQRKAVIKTLRSAKKSNLLNFAFHLESIISSFSYLPFGIRCMVTCRKPKAA